MNLNDKGSASWFAKKLIEAQAAEKNANNASAETEIQKVVTDSTLNDKTSSEKYSSEGEMQKTSDESLNNRSLDNEKSADFARAEEVSKIKYVLEQIPDVLDVARSNNREILNLKFKLVDFSANVQELKRSQDNQYRTNTLLLEKDENKRRNRERFFEGVASGLILGIFIVDILLFYDFVFPRANLTGSPKHLSATKGSNGVEPSQNLNKTSSQEKNKRNRNHKKQTTNKKRSLKERSLKEG